MEKSTVVEFLERVLSRPVEVYSFKAVGGGSISNAYKLETSTGNYFLKADSRAEAAQMFRAEGKGLKLLRANSRFTIPDFIGRDAGSSTAMLLMEHINSAARNKTYWQDLGAWLAELHRTTQQDFGLDTHNFIGSLPQQNNYESTWGEFFINQRIIPQARLALRNGLISASFMEDVETTLPEIINLMPEEPPSLVHGDLWSGNLMVDEKGSPCLVDPAVYFGHREMDIAFSRLFGGFSHEFYQSYHNAYPMEPGIEGRIDLYNLYPLFVHLNLFGRSYFGQIEMIISRFR
ncbi:MAG: fructosamine kinase family protein [Bacteroidota bacterium]